MMISGADGEFSSSLDTLMTLTPVKVEVSSDDVRHYPLLGAMSSAGRFLTSDRVLKILQTNEPTSSEIPLGIKEDVYFVINNAENVSRKKNQMRAVYVDDCGAWTAQSCKTHHYIIKGDKLCYVDLKNGVFCQCVKKQFVPVDPEPSDEDIIVFKRYYLSLKRQTSYRKRISTVSRCPNSMSSIMQLALVEYIGKFPRNIGIHRNAKKTASDYTRTATSVKTKPDGLVAMKAPREVFQDMLLEGMTCSPRDLKQMCNIKYKKTRAKRGRRHRNVADNM